MLKVKGNSANHKVQSSKFNAQRSKGEEYKGKRVHK